MVWSKKCTINIIRVSRYRYVYCRDGTSRKPGNQNSLFKNILSIHLIELNFSSLTALAAKIDPETFSSCISVTTVFVINTLLNIR